MTVAVTVAVVAIGAAAWSSFRALWWKGQHAARCRHLATAREGWRQEKEKLAEVDAARVLALAERERARALAAGLEERLDKLDRALSAAKVGADPGVFRILDEIRGLQ